MPIFLIFLALLAACAPLPVEQAAGTPAARVARESLASLHAHGAPVGAGVAVGGTLLLTNAHVMRQAGGQVLLRRAADGVETEGWLVASSPAMDLALLRMPEGFLRPAHLAPDFPEAGDPVWALGPEGLGRGLAPGRVERPWVRMRRFGPGFTARLGALMGFSGGPVVDREGRVTGLTTALPGGGEDQLLAMVTGVDLAGLADGGRRQVFILDIREAIEEARRIAPPLP
ncbi:S1 family peptidase [Roseococcus sp. YIM B11640]|uniref:S1 family peptidase n=1 Tax=Roseococcus sp. YIM B11640 TaxID=3133973 RepID=UPI003C7E418A